MWSSTISPLFLRQGLNPFVHLELSDLARLVGQRDLGILPPLLFSTGIIDTCWPPPPPLSMTTGVANSDPILMHVQHALYPLSSLPSTLISDGVLGFIFTVWYLGESNVSIC